MGLIKIVNSDIYNSWHGYTPGEKAHFDLAFRLASHNFCRNNDIEIHDRYVKVRIVRESGKFNVIDGWWKNPEWQDKTFWCYQTPVKVYHKDTPLTPNLWYALEMMECERVRLTELDRTGMAKWAKGDSLLVPCDCCDQCWDETQAGVSEHVRERASIEDVKDPEAQDPDLPLQKKLTNLKTQKDREEEEALKERATEIEKNIVDVEDDPRWNKDLDTGVLLQ